MTSWTTKKLGEVCEIISPGIKKFEGSKKYVATADVDFDKIVNFTEITYKNRPSRANIEVKENDVLVARMAETKKFLIADKNLQDNYIFSTGFAVMRVKEELTPRYLFYFLTTKDFNLQKDKLAVGATQKAINNPALKKIKIPLPPLKIQQKIVERLDAIKKAQELNDKQIQLAEELFQSLLHRELDPKGKNWEVKKLREVCEELFAGGDVPKNNFSKIKTEKYFIPIFTNGVEGKDLYGYTDIKKVIKPAVTISARGTIGYSSLRKEPFYPIIRLIVLIPNKTIDLNFLYYTTSSFKFFNTGTSIPQLTIPMIKNLKIPLPPLETQQKIVEKLSAAQEYKKKLLEQKQKLQELFESVLNKSFKGVLENSC